jgi:hypothetical protein
MSTSRPKAKDRAGRSTLRRLVPLAGSMLATVALFGAAASSAAAEPVGFFIAGEKSEEAAKQPKFTAEKYTANVKGSSLSSFVFKSGMGKYTCGKVEYTGTIAAAASALPITSFFTMCRFIGLPSLLQMNGCTWALNTLNAGPPYVGTMDIVCPAGKSIEVSTTPETGFNCTVSIPGQSGLTGVSFENTGSGSSRAVTANINLTEVKHSTSGTPVELCKPGEYTNGTYTGSASFTATK